MLTKFFNHHQPIKGRRDTMKEVNKIYNGKCLDVIKDIESSSIDSVITSPPYWQLRDYGWDGQWGLEPTYEMYLENLWSLMDEIYRVLKPGGTAWINLGDTYSGSGNGQTTNLDADWIKKSQNQNRKQGFNGSTQGLEVKNKCLLLIPHRFAIGCIDRGWIIRNDVVWAKPNGMPESVTDRFTKKHEYFFFMVKNQDYYFDLDGIRDKHKLSTKERFKYFNRDNDRGYIKGPQSHINKFENNREAVAKALERGKNPGSVSDFWEINTQSSSVKHYATYNFDLINKPIIAGCPEGGTILDPFAGTGTTGERALQLGRNFIGIEGSEEYCKIGNERLENNLAQTRLF